MGENIEVFDFQRLFLGDEPPLFLLEIVVRTLIMYSYTIVLLRILGKRGMGQLSVLELAIIISFGSAVGDPMIGSETPILHGIVCITCVAAFQIILEFTALHNKKVESVMEGSATLLVEDSIINCRNLLDDKLSKEDLIRGLRMKDIEHLGQIDKAYMETSGQISILLKQKKDLKPGMPIWIDEEKLKSLTSKTGTQVLQEGIYCCKDCNNTKTFNKLEYIPTCRNCSGEWWINLDTINYKNL